MLTPEEAPTLKRSNILVESKRMWNLGEVWCCTLFVFWTIRQIWLLQVLNGGPISRISLPTPVISFDENHYYRFDRVVNDILQSGPAQEKSKNGSLVPTLNSEQRLAERVSNTELSIAFDKAFLRCVQFAGYHEHSSSGPWICRTFDTYRNGYHRIDISRNCSLDYFGRDRISAEVRVQ